MNPKETFEKKLRAVVREIDLLHERISHPKSEKLDQPIQKGWKRFYVLTEDARKRKDRAVLEEILQEIGTVQFFRRRNFRRGKQCRKHLVEIKQHLRNIPPWDWKKKSFSKKWDAYFYEEIRFQHNTVYKFLEPTLFKLKTDRHWLTHIRILDTDAIQRKAELDRWMELNQGRPKHDRLKGGSWFWPDPKFRKSELAARRDLQRQIIEASQSDSADETVPPKSGPFSSAVSQIQKNYREKNQPQPGSLSRKNKDQKTHPPLSLTARRPGSQPGHSGIFPGIEPLAAVVQKMPALAETEKFSREATARFIQRQDYTFRLVLPGKRIPIGCIGLHTRDPSVPSYEIGYWLHSAHTGRGYMSEAVQALVNWGRDVAGAKRILIRAQTINKASWSIPKRLGFKFEGVQRSQIRDNAGKLADMRTYSIVFPD